MSMLEQPGWLRGLEIVTGVLAILSGILVILYPGLGIGTLVILLAVALIFVGIRSIAIVGYSRISKGLRAGSVIAGILALIIAPIVLLFPGLGTLSLIFILGYGLLAYGLTRIYIAYELRKTEAPAMGYMVAVGVIDIILSILVLVLPDIALLSLAVILALAFLVIGAEMLYSGVVGRTWLGNVMHDIAGEEKSEEKSEEKVEKELDKN
jgi:uncharacterized membrane protein HdeD (DUF308 family)